MPLENHSFERSSQDSGTFRLESMGEEALLELRAQIDDKLNLNLSDLNTSKELAFQLRQAKALYNRVSSGEDSTTPANQLAQVLNTVTTLISNIIKMESELYNVERSKKIEEAVLKAVNTLPLDSKKAFMELYAQYLRQDTQRALQSPIQSDI